MKYKIVETEEVKVIGVECRLNLSDESASTKIGNLWNKFFSEKMLAQIVDAKKPINTLGLYTNYDHAGNYSLVVGCCVSSLDNIPDEMMGYTIPAAKYAVFTVKGQFPQAVSDFWQELWRCKDSLGFHRAFTSDFELYDHRFASNNPEVDVYIAIEEESKTHASN